MRAALKYLSADNRKNLATECDTIDDYINANEVIFVKSGIVDFFTSKASFTEFKALLIYNNQEAISEAGREYGDVQTPEDFTDDICLYLRAQGIKPTKIIEPTFGKGNFIISALKTFPETKEIYGVEIQEHYVWEAKFRVLDEILSGRLKKRANIRLNHDNIFSHSFEDINAEDSDYFLIIGNPPWVTNSELSELKSQNIPQKENFKAHKGLDAITGKSNFDICESIVLKILNRFSGCHGKIAMICKNIVVRNILLDMPNNKIQVSDILSLAINTKKVFGASCNASIFFSNLGQRNSNLVCTSGNWEKPNEQHNKYGWVNNKFVSDVDKYVNVNAIDGVCSFTWRQGLKHDCSKIMELERKGDFFINGFKEPVDIEDDLVFTLLKSSDLKAVIASNARKFVLVTQKNVGAETNYIQLMFPKLWNYLLANAHYLDNRKSSIYKKAPRFSMFGIGEYSFKPYKVAVSGLYKQSTFSLVLPRDNKPIMLDDTCYFLSFDNLIYAVIVCALLNSKVAQDFLSSISFLDSKRPYTKDVLMRIDLNKLCEVIGYTDFCMLLEEFKLDQVTNITSHEYLNFKSVISGERQELKGDNEQIRMFA